MREFDGYCAVEPCVAGFPHFTHASGTDRGKDLIRAEPVAG
jgi:hypothetical protein